jgi:protein-S-isoprenylcysteine O-methyltransferase Ste14
MSALNTAVFAIWALFWVYWLIAAIGVKRGPRRRRAVPPGVRVLVLAFVAARVSIGNTGAVRDLAVQIAGTVAFVCGIALAVWARIYLGRNWGMPMAQKDEPELVTSGPYRFVRHPIYTGILLAMVGTAVATNVYWLLAAGVAAAYFVHSARVEERILLGAFPGVYPGYRARTKMLIPFVL